MSSKHSDHRTWIHCSFTGRAVCFLWVRRREQWKPATDSPLVIRKWGNGRGRVVPSNQRVLNLRLRAKDDGCLAKQPQRAPHWPMERGLQSRKEGRHLNEVARTWQHRQFWWRKKQNEKDQSLRQKEGWRSSSQGKRADLDNRFYACRQWSSCWWNHRDAHMPAKTNHFDYVLSRPDDSTLELRWQHLWTRAKLCHWSWGAKASHLLCTASQWLLYGCGFSWSD